MSRDHSVAPVNESENAGDVDEAIEGKTVAEFIEAEKRRIIDAGGTVDEKGYVTLDKSHKIHMTRTIGNFCGKQRKDLPREKQIVTAEPEVHVIDRSGEVLGGVMILASDGVWDVLSNYDCATFVRQACREETKEGTIDLDAVSEKLALHCLAKGSQDNISAIVVSMGRHGSQTKQPQAQAFPFLSPLPPAHPRSHNSARKKLALDV